MAGCTASRVVNYEPVNLKIENQTKIYLKNTTGEVRTHNDNSRFKNVPKIFNNISVPPGGSWVAQEPVYNDSPTTRDLSFLMTIYFNDGTSDRFIINMNYALGNPNPNFTKQKEDHLLKYRRESPNTLVITIEHTLSQLNEMQAEELMKTATKLIKQQQYDDALVKITEAESLANKPTTRQSIRDSRAKIKYLQGKAYLELALLAESDENVDRSKEAADNLLKAKQLFSEANSISTNWEYRLQYTNVNNKIKGNDFFNEGNRLESEAFQSYSNKLYSEAKAKYKAAMEQYQKAKEKYLENQRWEDEAKLVDNAIKQIENTLKIKLELQDALRNVTIENDDGKDKNKIEDEINVERQIDE